MAEKNRYIAAAIETHIGVGHYMAGMGTTDVPVSSKEHGIVGIMYVFESEKAAGGFYPDKKILAMVERTKEPVVPKTYGEGDLTKTERSPKFDYSYSFSADIASEFPKAFKGMNNNEASIILKEAKVFGKNDLADSEHSCFYAHFKTKRNAVAFIRRLNKFVKENS